MVMNIKILIKIIRYRPKSWEAICWKSTSTTINSITVAWEQRNSGGSRGIRRRPLRFPTPNRVRVRRQLGRVLRNPAVLLRSTLRIWTRKKSEIWGAMKSNASWIVRELVIWSSICSWMIYRIRSLRRLFCWLLRS